MFYVLGIKYNRANIFHYQGCFFIRKHCISHWLLVSLRSLINKITAVKTTIQETEIARLKSELSKANKQIKNLSKNLEKTKETSAKELLKNKEKSKEKIAKLQKELKKKDEPKVI